MDNCTSYFLTIPKALRCGIKQLCGKHAKVQRCRIHKIRNVSQRLPKDRAEQVRWLMKQAFKLDAPKGKQPLRALAKDLHPDAAASVLEGIDEMFTITELGITGELARCLATTKRASDQLQGCRDGVALECCGLH